MTKIATSVPRATASNKGVLPKHADQMNTSCRRSPYLSHALGNQTIEPAADVNNNTDATHAAKPAPIAKRKPTKPSKVKLELFWLQSEPESQPRKVDYVREQRLKRDLKDKPCCVLA